MFKLFNLRRFVTEIVLDLLHPVVRRELSQLEFRVGRRLLALEKVVNPAPIVHLPPGPDGLAKPAAKKAPAARSSAKAASKTPSKAATARKPAKKPARKRPKNA